MISLRANFFRDQLFGCAAVVVCTFFHSTELFGKSMVRNAPFDLNRAYALIMCTCCCCCCWLPDPFRGMGAWRNTMEPQKPSNSPGSGPEVVKRQRVAKECAAQRVRSWTVQNEMRDVLGRVSTSAAGRILDSANPREIRT